MSEPDPKPTRRHVATASEWKRLRGLKLVGRECRVCGKPASSLHHLVSRGLGGDDFAPNLVPLDGDGTTGCHGKIEAMDLDARVALRCSLTHEEVAYIVARKGKGWLDVRYPAALA